MACCAFAVLLLSQLLAPFVWARRRVFGVRVAPNVAVAWSLVNAAPVHVVAPVKRAGIRNGLFLAIGVELAIAIGLLAHLPRHDEGEWVQAMALDGAWCRGILASIEGGADGYGIE